MRRLATSLFRLPVEKIRAGYKTDAYFNRSRTILWQSGNSERVTMQLFQKVDGATIAGIDETLALFEVGAGHYRDWAKADELFERFLAIERREAAEVIGGRRWRDVQSLHREQFEVREALADLWVSAYNDLAIQSLADGDEVRSRETVMLIDGELREFVHLETLYLGVLSSGTRVATNTRAVVSAANGKPVIMFGARHEGPEFQAGTGYAARIGGASSVSTDEQAEWFGERGVGTIPHALIAAFGGDTVLATSKFAEIIDPSVTITALVDFDNDSVGTTLAVADALRDRLWGVRLDTSENMVDRSIWQQIMEHDEPAPARVTGVTPELVWNVRQALDDAGYGHVKIVASGGFDPDKISRFESAAVPVDAYGVGSALLENAGGRYDYTADVVQVNGENLAKKGRAYRPNQRLKRVKSEE